MKPTQLFAIIGLFGISAASGAVRAQEAADPGEGSAEVQAAAGFSAAEIDQFAKAAIAVAAIRSDTAISDEDRPARLAAAVEQSGLAPERFNEIAAASRDDEALMQQIQKAAANARQPDADPAAVAE